MNLNLKILNSNSNSDSQSHESYDILKNVSSRAVNYLKKILKSQRKKINQNLISDVLIELENKCEESILKNINSKEKINSNIVDTIDKLKSTSISKSQENLLPAIARKNILSNCRLLWQVMLEWKYSCRFV